MRKPFFWKSRGKWFVKSADHKRNIPLHEEESEAFRLWGEMLAAEGDAEVAAHSVAGIAERFLAMAERDLAADTYEQYAKYLAEFCAAYGHLAARSIKPLHVNEWLDKHPSWGDSSRRYVISVVKRCFKWAADEGYIPKSGIAGVKRPASRRREVLISNEDHARMVLETGRVRPTDRAFRPVLIALKHSGARPSMVARLKRSDVTPAADRWVLHEHKTRKRTGKPLVIYCSPCLSTLTKILLHYRQGETLFLGSRRQKWQANAIRCRIVRLRDKLGLEAGTCAYAFRHSMITNALTNGVPIATVAELVGHTDTRTISQHYGHLESAPQHLLDAAKKAAS